jgi:hypothetical protein
VAAAKKPITTLRHRSSKSSSPILNESLRNLAGRNPRVLAALQFLLRDAAEITSLPNLRIQPVLSSHRNILTEQSFFLPKERFGGSEDVPMVPLIRNVVDQTLRAYAHTFPNLLEDIGKTPISPYGSMALSVSRWEHVDWEYIRDLDWRIFLPPQIGHLSGFKADLERTLTTELHKFGLYPVLSGKDVSGLPQVQLRDVQTGDIHGFHFFLIAMKPGFVRGNIHRDGGYSPHYAYFPEGSIDEHMESASLQWSDVIQQQREDYVDMFNQLSFNIFGENTGESAKLKTPGWYLHKAFKWYATLARVRGLPSLEEDLLYQYEHFKGSEPELSYLARYRYYARMAPGPLHLDDLDRDLARVGSIVYAQARNPLDALVGQQISSDTSDVVLLEAVPDDFTAAATKLLAQSRVPLPNLTKEHSTAKRIRFADHLSAPSRVQLQDGGDAVLLPAEWSMVFSGSYIRQVSVMAAEEKQHFVQKDVHQALAVVLAALLRQALANPTDPTSRPDPAQRAARR